jgi:hypothetical protein
VDNRDPLSPGNGGALHLGRRLAPEKGSTMTPLETVQRELERYEHPFFEFSAQHTGKGVELCIRSKVPDVHSPEYRLTFADRDLQSTQFPWTFQRLLYDCLTDYLVELFTKSPMTGTR